MAGARFSLFLVIAAFGLAAFFTFFMPMTEWLKRKWKKFKRKWKKLKNNRKAKPKK